MLAQASTKAPDLLPGQASPGPARPAGGAPLGARPPGARSAPSVPAAAGANLEPCPDAQRSRRRPDRSSHGKRRSGRTRRPRSRSRRPWPANGPAVHRTTLGRGASRRCRRAGACATACARASGRRPASCSTRGGELDRHPPPPPTSSRAPCARHTFERCPTERPSASTSTRSHLAGATRARRSARRPPSNLPAHRAARPSAEPRTPRDRTYVRGVTINPRDGFPPLPIPRSAGCGRRPR